MPDIAMPYVVELLLNGLLFLLLISSAVTDIKSNSIYNSQTYTAIVLGFVLNFIGAGWVGVIGSIGGFVVGFALLFVFYLAGGFGAGDVKLLAAIGALKGVDFVLWTMVYSALVGGLMAFAVIIWNGVFWKTLKSCFQLVLHPVRAGRELHATPQLYLPYGVAISIGGGAAFFAL